MSNLIKGILSVAAISISSLIGSISVVKAQPLSISDSTQLISSSRAMKIKKLEALKNRELLQLEADYNRQMHSLKLKRDQYSNTIFEMNLINIKNQYREDKFELLNRYQNTLNTIMIMN